ncbi:hypothetical protein LguiB_001656 [Lonicera macranthoides]
MRSLCRSSPVLVLSFFEMKEYLPLAAGSHLDSSHHSADLSSPSWDHILQKDDFWTLPGL